MPLQIKWFFSWHERVWGGAAISCFLHVLVCGPEQPAHLAGWLEQLQEPARVITHDRSNMQAAEATEVQQQPVWAKPGEILCLNYARKYKFGKALQQA